MQSNLTSKGTRKSKQIKLKDSRRKEVSKTRVEINKG